MSTFTRTSGPSARRPGPRHNHVSQFLKINLSVSLKTPGKREQGKTDAPPHLEKFEVTDALLLSWGPTSAAFRPPPVI